MHCSEGGRGEHNTPNSLGGSKSHQLPCLSCFHFWQQEAAVSPAPHVPPHAFPSHHGTVGWILLDNNHPQNMLSTSAQRGEYLVVKGAFIEGTLFSE